ncbi:MAG: 2,3-bisphosphoglycerate-dependent phosphoglycerate mutase [Conexivisphaerales archaeon]
MSILVLVRHGESLWNKENRFTGWVDVPLTANGEREAREAGKLIRKAGIKFNVAYTSQLDRAINSLAIIMAELGVKLPVIKDYHLNERNYGDLQGLNKEETAKKYGQEQVHLWRRSYDIKPPGGESLEDTQKRTVPFFQKTILLDVTQYKKNVLVVAHGNSLRSIVMYLERIKPEQIVNVEIPTGVPIVYLLDENGEIGSKRVLGKVD